MFGASPFPRIVNPPLERFANGSEIGGRYRFRATDVRLLRGERVACFDLRLDRSSDELPRGARFFGEAHRDGIGWLPSPGITLGKKLLQLVEGALLGPPAPERTNVLDTSRHRLPARVLELSRGLGVERREPRIRCVLIGGFDELAIRIRGFGLEMLLLTGT
jgi:hypothetical protein